MPNVSYDLKNLKTYSIVVKFYGIIRYLKCLVSIINFQVISSGRREPKLSIFVQQDKEDRFIIYLLVPTSLLYITDNYLYDCLQY